ncbi:MAG: HTTM domain-containing protein [Acidimicrobiales bacterium]|nr:HTTM domain-containing protein [Acidimicrobiales bacterium]
MSTAAARLGPWGGAPAERLAALRIVLLGTAVAYLLVRLPVFLDLGTVGNRTFDPVGLANVLDRPLGVGAVNVLIFATVALGLAATAGAAYRITGPAFALGLLALTTYRSSFGTILWFDSLMVLHVLVLGLAPAADAWAVDSRMRSRRDRTPAAAGLRYGGPIALMAWITVVTYVVAGIAKLRYGGWSWLDGDTLRNHVAFTAARADLLGGRVSPVAGWLVRNGWLLAPFAAATVVLEFGAPVALLRGRWRNGWVLATWLLHVGIAASMFVVFHWPLLGAAFAPFFAVERVVESSWASRFVGRGLAPGREAAYEGRTDQGAS